MGISVNKAMKIGGLKRCEIVAGEKGVQNEIRYVAVMEVADTIRWLKGNELLLTTLLSIKDDPEAQSLLVQRLVDTKTAALAIKTYHVFEKIPQIILDEANRLNFPIIEIKKDVSYLDIMTPLMEEILDPSSPQEDDIDEIYNWISELALEGESLQTIIQTLEQVLGQLITLESEVPFIDISYKHDIEPLTSEQRSRLLSSKRPTRLYRVLNQKQTPCIVVPIILNKEMNGYVTCWATDKEFQSGHIILMERIVPLLALEFLKVKTRLDVEQKYKNDFLLELLNGKTKKRKLMEKSTIYNWDLTKNYQVMVMDLDQYSLNKNKYDDLTVQDLKDKILRLIESGFKKRAGIAPILGMVSNRIIVLYPVLGEGLQASEVKSDSLQYAGQLQAQVEQIFPEVTFTIGIGRFHQGIEGISIGYKEALRAISLGKQAYGNQQRIHFDDLGLFRILMQCEDRDELSKVHDETIGLLRRYDEQNNINLVGTLRVYFDQDCSLKETSQQLYIHVNTLKYRLQKIYEVTGYNVNLAEDRLYLHVGLKIDLILNEP